MERTYKATVIVIRNTFAGWTIIEPPTEVIEVSLDDDSGDGHTLGEIWEEVNDEFHQTHKGYHEWGFHFLEYDETTPEEETDEED